jgi:hypothetical protein
MDRHSRADQVHAAGADADSLSAATLAWLDLESPVPLSQWTGTSAGMHALADRLGLASWLGSPLLDPVAPEQASAGTSPSPPGLAEAWQALAQPEVRLDVAHVPPASAARVRFYGRRGRESLVGHWIDEGTHHVAWPIETAWLTTLVASFVEAARPAHEVGVSIEVDRAGLEVLVALIDLLQEASLVALLEGHEAGGLQVDARDVLAAFARHRSEHDLRWMIARARWLAPRPLAPEETRIAAALARLADGGWLVEQPPGYVVAPALRLVCALLADTRGWCAVSRRVRRETAEGGIEWSRHHGAVMRGLDSLWMLEFADVATDGFTARLRDATVDEVVRLSGEWFAPVLEPGGTTRGRRAAPAAGPPPLPGEGVEAAEEAVDWYYAIDRQRLGPVTEAEMRALAAQGTVTATTPVWNASMDQWGSAEAAGLVTAPDVKTARPTSPQFCPACGQAWRPGAAFCAACGAKKGTVTFSG